MQSLFPAALYALFFLIGLLVVLYRRGLARETRRQNAFLYKNTPALFPVAEEHREKLEVLVLQWLWIVAGLVFMAIGAYELWKLIR